jgi:hypothetical protein
MIKMGQRHGRNFSPRLIATSSKFSLVRIVYTLSLKRDTWHLAIGPILLQGILIGQLQARVGLQITSCSLCSVERITEDREE